MTTPNATAAHEANQSRLNDLIMAQHATSAALRRARSPEKIAALKAEWAERRLAINAQHDACEASYRAVMDADDERRHPPANSPLGGLRQ